MLTLKSILSLLSLFGVAACGIAQADCSVSIVPPRCELVRASEYAKSAQVCDVDRVAAAAARHELGGDDKIELVGLAAEPATLTADDRFCISTVELSQDGGMARVDLLISSPLQRNRRVARWFEVQRTGWYWEAVQSVAAGSNVSASDVRRRYGTVTRFPRIAHQDWPVNVRATATIGLGQVVAARDIEMVPLVGAGDPLELHVQSGPILMALKARSLSDAASGEITRLTLEHNGERTYAILLDQNTAIPCRLPLRDRIDDCHR